MLFVANRKNIICKTFGSFCEECPRFLKDNDNNSRGICTFFKTDEDKNIYRSANDFCSFGINDPEKSNEDYYEQFNSKIGDLSDGYHTFNELYNHRAVLFSVICKMFSDISWKSKKHSDGTMYDDMFIVGIETPSGQATYHYDIDPYWDMFEVKELEKAPEYDGHTPDDALKRIMSLIKND